MKNRKIFLQIIIISLGLIFYSHLFLVLYYTIWISKSIVIAYKICLYSLTFCYFFIIILEIPCIGNKMIDSINETGMSIFSGIYLIMIISEITILGVNLYNFSNYWANCPFTINEPNSNYHYKRRCELYGINTNSRYRYQYICSYNSFKDFSYVYVLLYRNYKPYYYLVKEYKIVCVQFKSAINNTIVDLFNKEYLNENKYYCGRIEIPTKNIFVEDRNCNNNLKKKIFYLFFFISILQILYAISHHNFKINNLEKANDLNLRRSQNEIQNSNNNNEQQSRSSTNISDNNNNINFKRLKTRNIIYINKKEITINQDINNISLDKSNQDINIINLNNEYIYRIRKENNT